MRSVHTDNAPRPVGPYSQATVSGNIVAVSGQIPIDPMTGEMPNDIEAQTRTVLSNLLAIFEASGVKDGNILSVTVYLSDMEDFPIVNSIYKNSFNGIYPARSCIGVNALPKGAKVMMDALGSTE